MKKLLRRLAAGFRHASTLSKSASYSPLAIYVDPSRLAAPNKLLRLGTSYGGWTIPADAQLNSESVCYLVGAGEDLSFDCALATRFHCRVRIIDPTPRAERHFRQLERAVTNGKTFPINNSEFAFYDISSADLGRVTFLPFGLADRDAELRFYLPKDPAHVSCSTVNLQKTGTYFTAQCFRLKTLMAMQGDARVDLLKMDIEGAECSVIEDIVSSDLLPRILLVEFDEAHTPLDGNARTRIGGCIRRLTDAGMYCVAIEGSNATFVRAG